MRYVISNVDFKEAEKIGKLYFKGPFKNLTNQKIGLLEGEIMELDLVEKDRKEWNVLENNYRGIYNYIEYNLDTEKLHVKNDHFGMLPVYVFFNKDIFFLSNNVWEIFRNIDSSNIQIDMTALKTHLVLYKIPVEGATFFHSVSYLPAASELTLQVNQLKLCVEKYWTLSQLYKDVSLDTAVRQLDESIKELFQFLKSRHSKMKFGFGNSGGIDSRIIPLYAKEFGLDIKGFIIGEKKPRKLLTATSHKSAHRIAKKLDFDHSDVSFDPYKNLDNRFFLDIRNNPFSSSQIFKNPYDKLPDIDCLICGGDGFIVSNDSNKWKCLQKIRTEEELALFLFNYVYKLKFATRKEKLIKWLGVPYKPKKRTIDHLICKKQKEKIIESFKSFIRDQQTDDYLSIMRAYHQTIFNKFSPAGGLESLNRTRWTYYLYYPFGLFKTLNWHKDLFFDRVVLKTLIKKKSKEIASVPDQSLNNLYQNKKTGWNKIELLLRSNGMNYIEWGKNKKLLRYCNQTLKRDNPLFWNSFDNQFWLKQDFLKLHPNILLDIVKTKKMLDIIYYKEYHVLDNDKFTISS